MLSEDYKTTEGTIKDQSKKQMVKKMNQFEQEIKRRIKHYYDQLAALENAYYNHEIESKEYIVEYEKIKGKIELLKG